MNRLQVSASRLMLNMVRQARESNLKEHCFRNGGRFVRVKLTYNENNVANACDVVWSTNEGRVEFSKAQQLIEAMLMAKRVREPGVYVGVKIDSATIDESGRLKCNLDYSEAVRIGGGDFDPAELATHVGNQEVTK